MGSRLGACRLCGSYGQLMDSHFLPAAIYKMLGRNGSSQADPVITSNNTSIQSSKQATAHLLCSDCEQRFSRNGERWVLKHCSREPGDFKLQDALRNALPATHEDLVPTASIRSIDANSIAYFAISVFWRASVHNWNPDPTQLRRVQLSDRNEESFRLYLLGKKQFPNNVSLLVGVSNDDVCLPTACTPFGGPVNAGFSYRFFIPGLFFILYIGREAYEYRKQCIVHSPGKRVIFARSNSMIRNIELMAQRDAQPLGKLAEKFPRVR